MTAGDLMSVATPVLMTRVAEKWGLRAVFFTSATMPLLFVAAIYLLMKPQYNKFFVWACKAS